MTPQPILYLLGKGWPSTEYQASITLVDAQIQAQEQITPSPSKKQKTTEAPICHFSDESKLESGRLDLLTQTSHYKDLPGSTGFYSKSLFKSLFVSDADKQKALYLSFRIEHLFMENSLVLLSKEVKVISKPSKKKVVSKQTDCMYSFYLFIHLSI